MKFNELKLHPKVLASVEEQGFTECTQIQETAIPLLLEGKDVAGLSQTGTGKTAAYVLPLVERILRSRETEVEEDYKLRQFNDWKPTNFFLVLVPTRELAEQVREQVEKMGKSSGMTSVAIYGGMSYEPQKKALNQGVQFVIATPGRLIDLFKDHVVDLNQVRAVVFDEADRMFDMGFKEDMKYILKRIPKDRQFIIFSATLNFDVFNVAYEFGSDPIELNVSKDQTKAENVTDEIFHVGDEAKAQYLLSLLKKHKPRQAIIFSNFKNQVQRISEFLTKNDIPAMGISSLLTQAQRNRVMDQFKLEGNNRNILVATDVAARGLDVKGVDLVVNYELSDDAENYVHRIGRTGRAGEKGLAFSLASEKDVEALSRIETYVGHKLTIGWLDDADIVNEFKEFPSDRRRDRPNNKGPRRDFKKDSKRGPKKDYKKSARSSQRDDRSKGREDKDENKKTSDQKSKEYDKPKANTHRDRVTGRHKPKSEKPEDRVSKKKTRKGTKRKSYKHKPQSERFHPESNPVRKEAGDASLGKKVAGFFKRLFD